MKNVVDLVLDKLRRLPARLALAMSIASQLGSQFNIAIACSMVEQWTTMTTMTTNATSSSSGTRSLETGADAVAGWPSYNDFPQ
jgi:hypothetical protein